MVYSRREQRGGASWYQRPVGISNRAGGAGYHVPFLNAMLSSDLARSCSAGGLIVLTKGF